MSKITPKNLHYDANLPPFLARLQASRLARDDKHEFDVARPRKKRDADEERENEPVYVDGDTGEVVSLEEKMKEGEKDGEKREGEKGDGKEGGGERSTKENMAVIGGTRKKRKKGKVVAEEEDGGGGGGEKEDGGGKEQEVKGKGVKKGKKIKLSFGDE